MKIVFFSLSTRSNGTHTRSLKIHYSFVVSMEHCQSRQRNVEKQINRVNFGSERNTYCVINSKYKLTENNSPKVSERNQAIIFNIFCCFFSSTISDEMCVCVLRKQVAFRIIVWIAKNTLNNATNCLLKIIINSMCVVECTRYVMKTFSVALFIYIFSSSLSIDPIWLVKNFTGIFDCIQFIKFNQMSITSTCCSTIYYISLKSKNSMK